MASACITVIEVDGVSERIFDFAREAAEREMSQPKRVAPCRANNVAIVRPFDHPESRHPIPVMRAT